ncbi:MAG: hypothetical protein F4W95_11500 [Chloroflexi bacterium]|nr:hypothetical protein [Chloroflexota bacterium]MYD49091.1 hypothetical protein [Chloroflexota bacterium]
MAYAYADTDIAAAVARGLAASSDQARPDDAGRTPEKYADLSRDFRASARKHLREDGDLPQASNKAWGMVAETVKAVSAQHGGIIHQHRSIWEIVRQLSRMVGESGDDNTQAWINNSFMVARSLHTNFYEDEANEVEVAAGLELCEELSERLYELFWPEGYQS